MVALVSLIFAILGLLAYFSSNTKWSEIGRITYFAGLLVFLYQIGPIAVTFFHGR